METKDRTTIYEDAYTYDRIHPVMETEDLEFYRRLAQGKKVLEVACGSGRMTIPLAKHGIPITGLDLSEAMLAEGSRKANEDGLPIRWIHGDCTNFSIDEKFDLIFMTGNSLQHLHTSNRVLDFFARVKRHLQPNGIFAFDIFRPSLKILTRPPNVQFPVTRYRNRQGQEIILTESNLYNEITQINSIRWFHLNGEVVEKVDTLEMRQFFPEEMRLIIKVAGFQIERYLGNWNGEPVSENNFKQILVLMAAQ